MGPPNLALHRTRHRVAVVVFGITKWIRSEEIAEAFTSKTAQLTGDEYSVVAARTSQAVIRKGFLIASLPKVPAFTFKMNSCVRWW